ncbi:glucuronate isomerase [Maribacter confluentis]|uniref:Uronate isomerase n=1 Tax=Maribacter confluentis TaxID=1656093 RepID=A0ABT8RSE4_9FLAO|nr:glucuronate isomerase [Maribacter confluentis]MDO1513816.1 glucuronate isomerase [Maribacter confluentis]
MSTSASVNTTFINDDFLLENKFSQRLYHEFAAPMPIIDYHCHLPPNEIASNRSFENLTKIWINGDHYKWRAMRTFGIDEKYITGNAPDKEKFIQWAKTVPYTLRNPLYHWTHLELQRYFDINTLLNPNTANAIYDEATVKLQTKAFTCQNLINKMNVEVICTTEDPIDSLDHHVQIANSNFDVKVSTAFRPDKAILITTGTYLEYLDKLSGVSGVSIDSFKSLCDALSLRLDYFDQYGCKLSDHGLSYVPYREFTETEIESIFQKRRNKKELSLEDDEKFQTAILLFLCKQYHQRNWIQQFHLGALRNNNARMNRILGPDTGWDSIGDYAQAATLSKFLNRLDASDHLAKTILYNLNPADNEVLATMIGNFNDGKVKGKMQFGSGWWFLDQKDGMTKQINALSNMGLISCFIGMLTDSRSFLSYPRHEYFRRVLCNLFGQEMQNGELPKDFDLVGGIVQDICYNNAKEYFNF